MNSFAKKIDIAFEMVLAAFEDLLVMTENVTIKPFDAKEMQRSNDVRWLQMPYIAKSFEGTDMAGKYQSVIRRLVPVSINRKRGVPWEFTSEELNDAIENEQFNDAAHERIANDINDSVLSVVCNQGTLVQVKATAASEFKDVSSIEGMLNRNGVPKGNRHLALVTDDHNGLASDLANRGTFTPKTTKAYEEAWVGRSAGFDIIKLDSGIRCNDNTVTGTTIDTRSSASNYWVPVTMQAGTNGETPVDNRYQRVTVSSTTGVLVGDAFTIAGITECHHMNKRDTGVLKTFRVMKVEDGTHMTISPAIVSNQGGSIAEEVYQNCFVSASATAAITYLNIAAAPMNPFWRADAVWLIPGRHGHKSDGFVVRRGTTHKGKGIEVVMTSQGEIDNLNTKFRIDAKWGPHLPQPEMAGIKLFNQA